ncbi:hypothetical protein DY037_05395 [Apilactobacillus micheneri]|uniref:hypothetical protein n=1 Tax=Apilactobacillus micheneri TaxID=1899430 RepID=UPI00112EA444|nr:hypothetical protein [Apilactobacillus micheneri]TPR49215.1 hypothetical protein DY037_05395 [Apilactobacillus micheneri]
MPQHSAGYIRVNAVHSGDFVSMYNSQDKKISGKWQNQDIDYHSDDLLTFHGQSLYDYDSVEKQVNAFQQEVKTNLKIKRLKINSNTKRGNHFRDKNDCLTIMQSFDIDANPDLTPKEAHQMGNQLFNACRKYFKNNYNYDLNSGFVSTHIDRGQFKRQKRNGQMQVLKPHLHSHIVIPTNNSQGKSISPYMKKSNILELRDMSDQIVLKHGLKDFYLQKLANRLRPNPQLLDRKNVNNKSDIDIAIARFTAANRKIKYKDVLHDFKGTKEKRDALLKKDYGYQAKTVYTLDNNNGKNPINAHTVFTMKDFSTKKNHEACFYDVRDIGALAWQSQQQALNSLNVDLIDLKNTKNFAQTPHDYQMTLSKALLNNVPAHDVARDIEHQHLKEQSQKRQETKAHSEKLEPKQKVKKKAHYLQTILDIDASDNSFEFEVDQPLHYVSDDFEKRRHSIQQEYRKLMHNEHVDKEQLGLKDKVDYVQREDKPKENKSKVRDKPTKVRQQINQKIKEQQLQQDANLQKQRSKEQTNKKQRKHPRLK